MRYDAARAGHGQPRKACHHDFTSGTGTLCPDGHAGVAVGVEELVEESDLAGVDVDELLEESEPDDAAAGTLAVDPARESVR